MIPLFRSNRRRPVSGAHLSAAFATVVASLIAPTAHAAGEALRVCGDPGNMPLSTIKGEGYENRIAEVIAAAMGTHVQYFWRPSIERGLTRQTFDTGDCDLFMNLPAGYERVLSTTPLYRSTFVLVYREDSGIRIDSLDAEALKTKKVGVFQHSAIREALHNRGVRNVVIHHISHDADLKPELQPSQQVRDVIEGRLDIAAVWGPFAGWFKTQQKAPITLQPTNRMDDETPMEFSMAIGVRRTDGARKDRIENALRQEKEKIRQILVDYGVPLVRCGDCLVDGDLPSHGPYDPNIARERRLRESRAGVADTPPDQKVDRARVEQWLAAGANVQSELGNAVVAGDVARIEFLFSRGAKPDKLDPQGYGPAHYAAMNAKPELLPVLVARKVDLNRPDADGWSPIAHAVLRNDPVTIKAFVSAKADPDRVNAGGKSPLAIAIEGGKTEAAIALIEAGARIDRPMGEAGLTPLMLASGFGNQPIVEAILKRGVDVNAINRARLSALMIAAANERPEIVERLLAGGARRDLANDSGKTALDIARANGARRSVERLEAAGAASVDPAGAKRSRGS